MFLINDFNSPDKDLLVKANRQSLCVSRIHKILVNVHKVRFQGLPPLASDFFEEKPTCYQLRNSSLVQYKYNTAVYGFKSFKYNGAMLYNKMPPHFKDLSLLMIFKQLFTLISQNVHVAFVLYVYCNFSVFHGF